MKIIFNLILILSIIVCFSSCRRTSQEAKIDLLYNENNNYVYSIKKPGKLEMICLRFAEIKSKDYSLQGCIFKENSKLLALKYAREMMASLYFTPNPKNILILGMGVGTLSKTLSEILPNSYIDVVDINSYLREINKKYFDFNLNDYKNIAFHLNDAGEFLKNAVENGKKYDLVINDAFDAEYIPKQFLVNEYMQMIKDVMTDDGIFSHNSFSKSETRALEDRLIIDNFGKNFFYYKGGNFIVFTTKDNNKNPMNLIDKNNRNYIYFKDIFQSYGIRSDGLINGMKCNSD